MKKQLLSIIFALLPMLAMADDSGSCGTNVTYTYNSTTKTLTIHGSGRMTNFSSSSSVPWYSYLEIIKKVIIEDGVTSIGNFAFCNCSGLTSITIPNSVTYIGTHAFYDCSSLKCVTIGNSVTSIGDYAFRGCSGLTSVTIPNSVTSIGYEAFYDCSSLKCVTIGNSVTSIGDYAFNGCSGLQKVIVPDIAAWCGIRFANEVSNPLFYAHHLYSDENTEIKDLVIPNSVTSIGEMAFYGCSGLTSVTVPNSVIGIEKWAFYGCSGLTSVTIGNNVTWIGGWAFYNCSSLTSFTIPNSVTSIGEWAFRNCLGLTSITIPNSVTSIGEVAFYGCSGLQSIYSKIENVFNINEYTFDDATYSNAKLFVPIGKKATYQNTDGWKYFANIEEFDVTNIAAQYWSKDARIVDVYKLNGQRSDDVRRGVNIIRMSDGTTRKVVVK